MIGCEQNHTNSIFFLYQKSVIWQVSILFGTGLVQLIPWIWNLLSTLNETENIKHLVRADKYYSTCNKSEHTVQPSQRRLRHVLDTSNLVSHLLTGKVVYVSGLSVHEYSRVQPGRYWLFIKRALTGLWGLAYLIGFAHFHLYAARNWWSCSFSLWGVFFNKCFYFFWVVNLIVLEREI